VTFFLKKKLAPPTTPETYLQKTVPRDPGSPMVIPTNERKEER